MPPFPVKFSNSNSTIVIAATFKEFEKATTSLELALKISTDRIPPSKVPVENLAIPPVPPSALAAPNFPEFKASDRNAEPPLHSSKFPPSTETEEAVKATSLLRHTR